MCEQTWRERRCDRAWSCSLRKRVRTYHRHFYDLKKTHYKATIVPARHTCISQAAHFSRGHPAKEPFIISEEEALSCGSPGLVGHFLFASLVRLSSQWRSCSARPRCTSLRGSDCAMPRYLPPWHVPSTGRPLVSGWEAAGLQAAVWLPRCLADTGREPGTVLRKAFGLGLRRVNVYAPLARAGCPHHPSQGA